MTTLDHLRKLLVRDPRDRVTGVCEYCCWDHESEDHAPDCAFEAAKAHVEQEDAVVKHLDGNNPETWAKHHGPEPVEIIRVRDNAGPTPRGFTLIELLVVVVIIVIVSAVALPTVISAMSHRQVSEGARVLQAALAGARDAAIRDNSPRGIRLLPDPALNGINPTTGLLDPARALAANRILPIGSAPDYSEGLLSTWQGPLPANVSTLPALMVFEAAGTWVQPDPKLPYVFLSASPASWLWNVRVGDKMQANNAGPLYTVVGPITTSNPELFCNIGPPGTVPVLPVTITSPDGQSVKVNPEYLLLVNGHDDNANGWIDEGFDGLDNDVDQEVAAGRAAATDDKFEWEQETWLGPAPHQAQTAVPYTIHRRPAPTGNARAVELPSNVVIDLSTWASTQERSRLPVNQFTGHVDILVNPNGTVVPTTIYSTPASVGMAGAFYHFWLAERSDVFSPQGAVSPVLPVPLSPRDQVTGVLLDPQPNRFNGAAIKGEYRLVTLFAKTGLTGQLEDMPFDWTTVGNVPPFTASNQPYNPGLPFVASQQGAR